MVEENDLRTQGSSHGPVSDAVAKGLPRSWCRRPNLPYVRGLRTTDPAATALCIIVAGPEPAESMKRKGRLLVLLNHVLLVIAIVLIRHPFHSHGLAFYIRIRRLPGTGRSPPSPKHRRRLGIATLRQLVEDEFVSAAAWPSSARQAFFYRSLRLMGYRRYCLGHRPTQPQNVTHFSARAAINRSRNAFLAKGVSGLCELGTHTVGDFCSLRPINHQ